MKNNLEETFDNKLSIGKTLYLTKKEVEGESKNKLVKMRIKDDDLMEINYHQSQDSKRVQRSRYLQIEAFDEDSKLKMKNEV